MTRFRITDPALVPSEFWQIVEKFLPWIARRIDEAKIRTALDQPCEECGGDGLSTDQEPDAVIKCPVCHGSGQRQIPGVERLGE